ncbi:hypothetical protein ACFPOE_00080 [Caenimonas terrae]|uniref:Copper-binding protein n=1 Tax=Caenimonas terrae TaxID=696074 RepID=A0ABW0NAC4_9BURK
MNDMIGRLAVCALLATAAPLALAVRPTEATASGRSTASASLAVERGGTIEAVDRAGKAIVIEGVHYAVPTGSMQIHWQASKVSGQWTSLEPGMQVRFRTVRDDGRKQDQLREIWVTGPARRPAR